MAYSEEAPEQPEKISLYNSGMAQIKRLDELWAKIHKYVEGGLLTKWNWGLDRIWCELIGDIPEDTVEDDDDMIEVDGEEYVASKKEKKQTDIERFESFKIVIGNINKDFIEGKTKAMEYQRQMYEALMQKEAFLRRLQNRLGKGTKLVDADEDMIE